MERTRRDVELATNRSGYWELRWSERQPDGTWRSRSASCRTKSRVAAEAFRDAWLAAEREAARAGRDPTLADLTAEYLTHLERRGVNPTSVQIVHRVMRVFGGFRPRDVTPDLLEEFRDQREADGLAPGSIRREVAVIGTVCRWAAKTKRLDRADVPYVELPEASAPRDVWLDERDEALLHALAIADSTGKPRLTRVTRFVTIALDTAARRGAIESLSWDRVDLDRRIIDFREPGRRVTKKRRVPVPIADRLHPILVQAKAEATSPWVCDHGDLWQLWRNFIDRIVADGHRQFRDIRPHDLRRTWATLAVRAGVPLWDVAGVLGDTPAIVTKHYAHHSPDYLRGAVNRRTAP